MAKKKKYKKYKPLIQEEEQNFFTDNYFQTSIL